MKRRLFRAGWAVAVLAVTTLACTCGLISRLGQGVQTAQTAQAIVTQVDVDGLMQTAQAAATEVNVGGEAPADIPVMDDKQNFFGSAQLVSYTTSASFEATVEFYRDEMTRQGWEEAEGAMEIQGASVVTYTKADRTAVVTVTETGADTTVLVALQPK